MTRNRPHTAPLALLLLLLASPLALGCGSRAKHYQDPSMDFGAVRTVAVLPFTNLSRDNLAAERVRDVYASMLLATGAVYVVPYGEVIRAVGRAGVAVAPTPATEEVMKLGTALKADALVLGTVKEYGEVRSGSASANVISVSVQLVETATGKVVWSGSTTKGGVTMKDRLLGGGGIPLNHATEAAVDDLLDQMFH
jgi:polysaccharide biosynthesis protein PelC